MKHETPLQFAASDYRLEDRYTKNNGRVFLTGTQAIARIAFDQARRDRAAGLNCRLHFRLSRFAARWRRSRTLAGRGSAQGARHRIHAGGERGSRRYRRLGSQQVETQPDREVDRACSGFWYGKAPASIAPATRFKHGNAYGSSPHGGVLVVAGDDPRPRLVVDAASTSDVAFMTFFDADAQSGIDLGISRVR